MPWDSSKVTFHDQMDMFFMAMQASKPPDTDKIKPMALRSKRNSNKGNKDAYLGAFENKMKEQAERRNQMLFLKRLENDGAQILISKADRELFRILSSKEEEQAERELESAIKNDNQAVMTAEESLLFNMDPEQLNDKFYIKKMIETCAETTAVTSK